MENRNVVHKQSVRSKYLSCRDSMSQSERLTKSMLIWELLKKENIKLKNYEDAGANFYQKNEASGASGPAVLPLYFFNNTIYNKKYKRILLLATGSLHSPLLVNQKESIPAVTHAIEIEVSK